MDGQSVGAFGSRRASSSIVSSLFPIECRMPAILSMAAMISNGVIPFSIVNPEYDTSRCRSASVVVHKKCSIVENAMLAVSYSLYVTTMLRMSRSLISLVTLRKAAIL